MGIFSISVTHLANKYVSKDDAPISALHHRIEFLWLNYVFFVQNGLFYSLIVLLYCIIKEDVYSFLILSGIVFNDKQGISRYI